MGFDITSRCRLRRSSSEGNGFKYSSSSDLHLSLFIGGADSIRDQAEPDCVPT